MNNQSATMNTKDNPLGYKKESTLLVGFAIPCIISMLVTALYNIVDQIFIGQGIGMLGNAATNIAFPLSTTCTAISLLLGIGSATNFSLYLGAGEKNESEKYAGNGIVLMALFGIFLFLVTTIFLTPMLKFFGATKDVLPYAKAYTRITAFGFPFLIANTGMSKLILADGSPRYSMISMLAGAIVNTILDPLFIFVFNMGMTGAALATIGGQLLSALWQLAFLFGKRTLITLNMSLLKLNFSVSKQIIQTGIPAFLMQMSNSVLNIILNASLVKYGGDLALSAIGIVTSIQTLILMPITGLMQGQQPLISYNFGARKIDRVKETLKYAIVGATVIAGIGFIAVQFFTKNIVYLFNNEEDVVALGSHALHIWFICLPVIGAQIICANYFQAIGKIKISSVLNLLRQVIILIPCILILSTIFGLDGIFMAVPIADFSAFVITIVLLSCSLKKEIKMS